MHALRLISLSCALLVAGLTACDGGQDGKASTAANKPAATTVGDKAADPGGSEDEVELPADAILDAPGVDLSKLDETQKQRFFSVLNTESSACDKPHSLAVSLRDDGECRNSMHVAQFIADRLAAGAMPADIKLDIDALVDALTPKDIPTEGRPVYGNERAPITLVVFADFQCPMCKAEVPELREAVDNHKGRVKLVFKHFPLPMHEHGEAAAKAGEAAHLQGKFWRMHDQLFAHQEQLGPEQIEAYAAAAGLDVEQFKADLTSDEVAETVAADKKAGKDLKIGGTPTVFVNGRLVTHLMWGGELDKWIEDALRR